MFVRIKQLISPYMIDFSLFAEALQSASSSIRSNKIRSFLTALAIIIGTAAVIAIIGLGSSAQNP